MQLTYNFSDFSAKAYLEEYYSILTEENKFLLDIYHDFYTHTDPSEKVIQLGTGPAIFLDITASHQGHSIIFAEYAKTCRDEVVNFLNQDPTSWNWDSYFEYVSNLYRKENLTPSVIDLKNSIRNQGEAVIPCNLIHDQPLTPVWHQPFDIVSMGSVAETVAANENEFTLIMKNSLNLLKPGGHFIGYFAKNCTRWTNLDVEFFNFPVNENYIQQCLPQFGLDIKLITNSVPPDYNQVYEGIFAVIASKAK